MTWSMVLMLMDLFYASIVFIKENIKGIIVDEGWLKITKATTEKEKENYITEMVADYPTCSSLYKNINVNDYSTKLELLEELERRLKMPVENKGIFDSITLSETTTGYLKVGIVIIGILGVVYIVMNKNKVWDYIIHLGETVSELVQTEREFAKTAATLLKNDETFAGLIQRVQHEIIDLKATSLSEEVLKELQNAILLVSKNTEMLEKYAGRLNLLETDITETGKILEEILKVNSNT